MLACRAPELEHSKRLTLLGSGCQREIEHSLVSAEVHAASTRSKVSTTTKSGLLFGANDIIRASKASVAGFPDD